MRQIRLVTGWQARGQKIRRIYLYSAKESDVEGKCRDDVTEWERDDQAGGALRSVPHSQSVFFPYSAVLDNT